jgi:hypothetical protein
VAHRHRLGPIVHLEVACASAGAQGEPEALADVIAADILPHFLGLTRQLLDVDLASQRWSVARPRLGEWRVTGRMGEISVAYLVSMAARPTFAELRVLGELASARADLFHGYATIEAGTTSRSSKIARPFRVATASLGAASRNLLHRNVQREPAYPGLTELVRRVHRAALFGAPGPISPAEILDIAQSRERLMALVDAGHQD